MPDVPIIIPFERIKIPLRSWDFSLNLNNFFHSPLVDPNKKTRFSASFIGSAEGGTWTLMSVSSLRPERSASANSATSACFVRIEFYLKGWFCQPKLIFYRKYIMISPLCNILWVNSYKKWNKTDDSTSCIWNLNAGKPLPRTVLNSTVGWTTFLQNSG